MNLRMVVKINWKGREYIFFLFIEVIIDVLVEKKGIYMSRFVESIIEVMSEVVEEEVVKVYSFLEEFGKFVIERFEGKYLYKRVEVWIKMYLIILRIILVSKKISYEFYDVEVGVIKNEDGFFEKVFRVRVIGNMVCLYVMVNNNGKIYI